MGNSLMMLHRKLATVFNYSDLYLDFSQDMNAVFKLFIQDYRNVYGFTAVAKDGGNLPLDLTDGTVIAELDHSYVKDDYSFNMSVVPGETYSIRVFPWGYDDSHNKIYAGTTNDKSFVCPKLEFFDTPNIISFGLDHEDSDNFYFSGQFDLKPNHIMMDDNRTTVTAALLTCPKNDLSDVFYLGAFGIDINNGTSPYMMCSKWSLGGDRYYWMGFERETNGYNTPCITDYRMRNSIELTV